VKIITWNVNGLRAVLNAGAWDWIRSQNADVICLQEIKTRPDQLSAEQLLAFEGYQAYWNPAERPGYSGVLTLVRQSCDQVSYGLGVSDFDIEGRAVLTRHPGFLLYNIYFPNGKRDLGRLTYKLDFYAHLLGLCDGFHKRGENVVICGDFNTAHQEIDLRNPKANSTVSGFLPEERAWIDRYLEKDFVDAYRVLYPERVQYTWWTYRVQARQRNIGWRLDYFLLSKPFMSQVKDVVVHEEALGSDHCPVSLLIE
jgi:exodeoxyribonuclease-3